jgi:dihydroorotate dehydrogenase (NAD+) catalytic subunit
VQVGTASYADPRAVQRIAESLERWCARHHIARVSELTGAIDLGTKASQPGAKLR